MMKHAGKRGGGLASQALEYDFDALVAIPAGTAIPGGSDLACPYHLVNSDIPITVVLDRPPDELARFVTPPVSAYRAHGSTDLRY